MAERRTPASPPVPGFPELTDAAVVWAPLPQPALEQEMRHTAGSWQPVLACENPACRGGGFDLGSVVEGMLSSRETEKAGILVCEGWEGSPPIEPAGSVPCVRAIRYRITLVYRTHASPAPPGGAGPKRAASPRDEG